MDFYLARKWDKILPRKGKKNHLVFFVKLKEISMQEIGTYSGVEMTVNFLADIFALPIISHVYFVPESKNVRHTLAISIFPNIVLRGWSSVLKQFLCSQKRKMLSFHTWKLKNAVSWKYTYLYFPEIYSTYHSKRSAEFTVFWGQFSTKTIKTIWKWICQLSASNNFRSF